MGQGSAQKWRLLICTSKEASFRKLGRPSLWVVYQSNAYKSLQSCDLDTQSVRSDSSFSSMKRIISAGFCIGLMAIHGTWNMFCDSSCFRGSSANLLLLEFRATVIKAYQKQAKRKMIMLNSRPSLQSPPWCVDLPSTGPKLRWHKPSTHPASRLIAKWTWSPL